MKKNTFCAGILLLFLSLLLPTICSAQDPNETSMALKTIQIADKELPIVLEDEVKGGHHQTEGHPSDHVEDAVLELGMLVTNSSTNQTYRYDGLDSENNNAEIWTPVFLVTNWDTNKTYKENEIVAYDSGEERLLYQALFYDEEDENGDGVPDNNHGKVPSEKVNYWKPLTAVGKIAFSYPSDNTPYTADYTNHGYTSAPADQTIINVGQTVVIIVDDYELPKAEDVKGQTYIIKNKRSNEGYYDLTNYTYYKVIPNTDPPELEPIHLENKFYINAKVQREEYGIKYYAKSQVKISAKSPEKIEGNPFKFLYQTNDYITLLSDGTQWIMINEGPTGSAYLYNGYPPVSSSNIDAIYWGNPDQNGSMRIISYVGYSTDESKNRIFQRLERFDGSIWSTMKTSVEDY